MKCIILCAGYATRLYPLTLAKPKSLLPIRGEPLLNNIIKKLRDLEDIDEIIIVTNDKFYYPFVWWLQNLDLRIKDKIEILNDGTNNNESRLGGLGDLKFALEARKIEEDVLVLLGDNYFNFDLRNLVHFYKQIADTCLGVIQLDKDRIRNFGVVSVDDNNKILNFEEKPEIPRSNLASTGIYIFKADDLKHIDECLNRGLKEGPGHLVNYLVDKKSVYAYKFDGWWFDIGTKEEYERLR
jgi:glucose-1-phosphate thymidylyltransferase